MVHHLVTDQLRAGWEVIAACPPTGPLSVEVASAGARVLAWPATREPGPVSGHETFRLLRLVESVGADVIHLHSAKAGLAGRLAIRGRKPTVYQPHAWSFWAATGWQRAGSLAWERYGARWTDQLVLVSERERGGCPARHPGRGRRGAQLRRRRAVRRPGRQRAGRRPRHARPGPGAHSWSASVGCAGRRARTCCCGPGRGSPRRCRTPGWCSSATGPTGPGWRRTRRRASCSPVGPRDPRPWYAAADVVVLPSRWEGLALVLLEAMASARSVVSTDVGGAREALPADGGAVVPVGDPAAPRGGLVARLRDPALAAAEGAAGRARACAGPRRPPEHRPHPGDLRGRGSAGSLITAAPAGAPALILHRGECWMTHDAGQAGVALQEPPPDRRGSPESDRPRARTRPFPSHQPSAGGLSRPRPVELLPWLDASALLLVLVPLGRQHGDRAARGRRHGPRLRRRRAVPLPADPAPCWTTCRRCSAGSRPGPSSAPRSARSPPRRPGSGSCSG